MIRRRWISLGTVIAVLNVAHNGFTDGCRQSCVGSIPCHVEVTNCLIESGRVREAIDRLKVLREKHPNAPAYGRLLAQSYLADGNAFWAERVLVQMLEENPADCESRSWLVWIYIQSGDLEQAREVMHAQKGCLGGSALYARWQVLENYLARAKGDDIRARKAFEKLGQVKEAYPEDVEVWQHLNRQENPGWIEPLSFRLMLSGGFTSNARAGSPADPSVSGSSSGLGRLDLYGRLVIPTHHFVRPALDGNVKAHGLTVSEARELSYLDLAIRPGVIIGDSFPSVLLAYRGNLLLIGLDGKELFYEAHRGEIELETQFGLLAFAGAGRRIFREGGRTRTELDGGLGASFSPHQRFKIMAALSGKYYFAVGNAYEQVGGMGLLVGRIDFVPGLYGRIGVTPGVDYYPESGGAKGLAAFGTRKKRFDFLLKQFEELWSPALWGVRIGLRYEFSFRYSTADADLSDYNYSEHRALFNIRWHYENNPWAPRKIKSKDRVPMRYQLEIEDGKGFDEDRIQDLLRQDEAARAGSSCVE